VGNSRCFNLAMSGSLDSSVCSTTPLGDRVYCYYGGRSQLQNNCSEEAVWQSFFFLFFAFILLFVFFFLLNLKRKKVRIKVKEKG
jgi:hypothetical protein